MKKCNETDVKKRWYFKDPASFISHFIGFLAAVVGLIFLMVYSPGPPLKTASFLIYGICASFLFLASATYHFFDLGERGNFWLRRLDHCAIFLMIIGSYVPMIMHALEGGWRFGILLALAILGLLGITFKLTWFNAPRWVTVGMYLVLGWIAIIPGKQLIENLTTTSLTWTLIGGIFYTVGAVVYATKWPNPSEKYFNFHDVWHLFVLAGAGAHFGMVWTLLPEPIPY